MCCEGERVIVSVRVMVVCVCVWGMQRHSPIIQKNRTCENYIYNFDNCQYL